MYRHLSNQRGLALIQVLMGLGLLSVLVTGFATYMSFATRQSKGLYETMGKVELERFLLASLADGSVCTFEFKDKEFNANDVNSTLPMDRLRASASATAPNLISIGEKASPSTPNLVVKSISLGNFRSAGMANKYMGDLKVGFKDEVLAKPIKPITIRVNLSTTPTSPATAKKIESCAGGGSLSLGACPAGQFAQGFDATSGALICEVPVTVYQ